jgi:hypothetical protein
MLIYWYFGQAEEYKQTKKEKRRQGSKAARQSK